MPTTGTTVSMLYATLPEEEALGSVLGIIGEMRRIVDLLLPNV